MVSRRNLVALIAGTAAAAASPAVAASHRVSVAAQGASAADVTALIRRRVLSDLTRLRRARGSAGRAAAFASLAHALRLHDAAGSAHEAAVETALYRGRNPNSALAQAIVRELETRPALGAAWMTRFADLEAVIAQLD